MIRMITGALMVSLGISAAMFAVLLFAFDCLTPHELNQALWITGLWTFIGAIICPK